MSDKDELRELRALLAAQTERIAELTGAVHSLAVGKPEVGADLTVQKLRDEYEVVVKSRAAAVSLRMCLAPAVAHFATKKVLSLRRSDWIDFRDNVRGQQFTERGTLRAPGTLNQETHAFMAMINWAVNDGRLARNPLYGPGGPGKHRQGIPPLPVQERKTTIPREREDEVMKAAHPVLATMFTVALDSGMRLNEIRCLEWSWVDLDAGVIHLPAHITKTRKARDPRLTERAVEALRQTPRRLKNVYVFPSPVTGKPYTRTAIWTWWSTARTEAGLVPAPGERSVVFHATRHTAATRINKLSGAKVAMRQLGQSSAAIGLKYIHATDEDLDEMRDKLDASIKESRKPPQRVEPRTEKSQATDAKAH